MLELVKPKEYSYQLGFETTGNPDFHKDLVSAMDDLDRNYRLDANGRLWIQRNGLLQYNVWPIDGSKGIVDGLSFRGTAADIKDAAGLNSIGIDRFNPNYVCVQFQHHGRTFNLYMQRNEDLAKMPKALEFLLCEGEIPRDKKLPLMHIMRSGSDGLRALVYKPEMASYAINSESLRIDFADDSIFKD